MRRHAHLPKLAIVLTWPSGCSRRWRPTWSARRRAPPDAPLRDSVAVTVVAAALHAASSCRPPGVRPDPVQHRRVPPSASAVGQRARAVPDALPAYARPRAGAAQVGVVPAGSKYYGIPIVAWVEETLGRRSLGARGAPLHVAAARGMDPTRWPEARRDTGAGARRPLAAHGHGSKFGKVLFRAPGATGASSTPTPIGEYFVTDRVPFSGGSLRDVRVRHQRHPASTSRRLDRREPARDPRHEQPVVDRAERERRLRPCVRGDPGPPDPAAAVRHTRHRARLARNSDRSPSGIASTNSFRSLTCASSCSNGPRPTRSCPIRCPSDFRPLASPGSPSGRPTSL